jgi:hypothetical protein
MAGEIVGHLRRADDFAIAVAGEEFALAGKARVGAADEHHRVAIGAQDVAQAYGAGQRRPAGGVLATVERQVDQRIVDHRVAALRGDQPGNGPVGGIAGGDIGKIERAVADGGQPRGQAGQIRIVEIAALHALAIQQDEVRPLRQFHIGGARGRDRRRRHADGRLAEQRISARGKPIGVAIGGGIAEIAGDGDERRPQRQRGGDGNERAGRRTAAPLLAGRGGETAERPGEDGEGQRDQAGMFGEAGKQQVGARVIEEGFRKARPGQVVGLGQREIGDQHGGDGDEQQAGLQPRTRAGPAEPEQRHRQRDPVREAAYHFAGTGH